MGIKALFVMHPEKAYPSAGKIQDYRFGKIKHPKK